MIEFDPATKSLRGLATALRSGSTTAEALMLHVIQRYETLEPVLNAYFNWDGPKALDRARLVDRALHLGQDLGPMMGLPVSVKDIYGVPGLSTFAGTPRRLPEEYQTAGPLVAALMSQLAIIPGKTHTVEFAFGGLGINNHWGTPRNPWDAVSHRVPGGSSAGAGVSLAQSTAFLALGTDTAGSVRIPASMTGNAGLKTTRGRWSIDGITPLSPSFDTPGLLARSVDDLAFAFDALDPRIASTGGRTTGYIHDPAGLRVAVVDNFFWEDLDPGIGEAVEGAIKELSRKGVRVERCRLEHAETAYDVFIKGGLAAVELAAFLRMDLPDWVESLDPIVRARVDAADTIPSWDYVQRRTQFARMTEDTAQAIQGYDALITPTLACTPPAVDSVQEAKPYAKANLRALRNTSIGNCLGLCAVTLPVGLDAARMPVGLQLMAAPGRDAALLGISLAVERVLGQAQERLGTPPATDVHA